jgi:hypothetical protein
MSDLDIDWPSIFDTTLEICQEDEAYASYTVREKMLAFIFTFLQSMNKEDTKYSAVLKQRIPLFDNAVLRELKVLFFNYCDTLMLEGTNSGEIQARPFIANYYRHVLWNAFVSILYFWAGDTSEHHEKTDVLVEKTVHFSFDLLAPNAIDSGIDLIQNIFKLRK